jgi:ketosteroid isomerase-like protein
MSQENVEIVRRYVEALEKAIAAYWSDPRPAAAAMEKGELRPEDREVLRYLDPDVEWNTAFAGVSFRGHLGIAQGWDWLAEAAERYTVSLKDVTTLPDDRVLGVVDGTLKAKDSGIEITAQVFSIATVREEVITRMDEYNSRPEALEAVGLSG